jgi:hypothetical protein
MEISATEAHACMVPSQPKKGSPSLCLWKNNKAKRISGMKNTSSSRHLLQESDANNSALFQLIICF